MLKFDNMPTDGCKAFFKYLNLICHNSVIFTNPIYAYKTYHTLPGH